MAQDYGRRNPGSTVGQAAARPNWDPRGAQTLEEWMTEELRRNPNYQIPNGWRVNENGSVEKIPASIFGSEWLGANPWAFPVAGAGAGAGLYAAGVGGAAGAGSGSGAGYVAKDVASAAASGGGAGGAAATIGGAAAASTPWWKTALQVGVPLAATVASTRQNRTPEQDPAITDQFRQIMEYGNRRLARTEPVHEAAMKLAMNMGQGPSEATSQRMGQAIQSAQAPRQESQFSPEVLEAIRRMMGGQ